MKKPSVQKDTWPNECWKLFWNIFISSLRTSYNAFWSYSLCIFQVHLPMHFPYSIFCPYFFCCCFSPPPTYSGPFEMLHPSTQRVLSNLWVCPTLIKTWLTLLLAVVNCQYLFHKEWDLCTPHSILEFWLAWTCPGPKQSIMAIISSLISVQKHFFPPVIHHFCFWPLPSFVPMFTMIPDSWEFTMIPDSWEEEPGHGGESKRWIFFFFKQKVDFKC